MHVHLNNGSIQIQEIFENSIANVPFAINGSTPDQQENGLSARKYNIWTPLLIISLIIIAGHISIIFIIQKARIRENRYFLIQILSLSDTLVMVSFSVACASTFIKFGNSTVEKVTSFGIQSFHALSLQVTILITIDRLIAVQNGIHYHLIINKTRLVVATAIAFIINTIIFGFCFAFGQRVAAIGYQTKPVQIYVVILRIVTCISIITIGKISLRIRNEKMVKIEKSDSIRGVKEETLEVLRKLARGIKDIAVLNLWTCFFLVPVSMSSLMILIDIGLGNKIVSIGNGCALFGEMFSNPIIYVVSQSKIRNWVFRKSSTSSNS